MPPVARRKFWGWGREDQQPSHEQVCETAAGMRAHLGFGAEDVERPAALEDLELAQPRLRPPASLAPICTAERYERAAHTYGKSYRDVVRAFRGRLERPPDVVAHPRDERDIERILDWCASAGAAAIPYGGGTSVVGGVEAAVGDGYAGAVSIDLGALDRVLEVDPVSRAARIQAGATGPRLEQQLRPHELTLRFFPQSFEQSTLGGWIATRAGGHFATLMTHIDDLVESVRAITPSGVWESRRLPGSGAGPSPDRALIGSEGVLGVITEAWVRVQARPRHRGSATLYFYDFTAGAAAVRALAQSGLHPANCRLLEPAEAALTGAGAGDRALLLLGFESAERPLGPELESAIGLCRELGGALASEPRLSGPEVADGEGSGSSGGGSGNREGSGDGAGSADGGGAWRSAFLQAPYLRDVLVACGVISETFETAMTWDRLDGFVAGVRERVEAAVHETCGAGRVMCRITHAYPDGAAPYFTVIAPGRRGAELEQWEEIKVAASEAIVLAGGTITHHHAVGRDHRRWYDRQRPEPFAAALRAAKSALDPAGVLNPGVLIDPARESAA